MEDTVQQTMEYMMKRVRDEEEDDGNSIHHNIGGICGVCGEKEGKYKCKGCYMRYCTPACIHIHINMNTCKRDKLPTAYKKRSEFNERDMMRDFNYISGMMEGYDRMKKKLSIIENSLSKHQEMVRYKILLENAKKQHITLKFAPRFIQRHRENISFYYTKDKKIYWMFELIMPILKEKEDNKIVYKRHVTPPMSEESLVSRCVEEFIWSDIDVLLYSNDHADDDSDEEKEKNGGVQSVEDKGYRIYMKNTYVKSKAMEEDIIDEGIRQQIEDDCKMIHIPSERHISSVIRCMDVLEYPTLYIIKHVHHNIIYNSLV